VAKPEAKAAKSAAKTVKSLAVGSHAPEFDLPATMAGTVSTVSLKGKPYVLYFYPKDDTSGCTAEACEFRNELSDFANFGVTIIGVSKDNLESHEKFSRKYNLTFPLASDEKSDVCEKFGVWGEKSMYGRTYMGIERSTFLVDGEGVIRSVWRKVSVPGHVEDVKKAIAAL
jgi:peroxiredoxin Q/BCP